MENKIYFSPKLTLLIASFWCISCAYGNQQPLSRESLRKDFLNAEKFISQNEWKKYNQLKTKLVLYPLYPELLYQELKHKIETNYQPAVSFKEIDHFANTYPDYPLKNNLKTTWVKYQTHYKQWDSVVLLYNKDKNLKTTRDQCYYLNSLYHQNPSADILKQASVLWMVGHSQPSNCDTLFGILKTNGKINTKEKINRISLAIEKKNYTLANYLVNQLPPNEKKWGKKWINFLNTPELILKPNQIKQAFFPEKYLPEVLTSSVQKLARKNATNALTWWKNNQNKYAFSKEQIKRINRDLAVYLAHQKQPNAYQYISSLSEQKLDLVAKEWRIRLSLFEKKWPDTVKWIERLPKEEQSKPIWRYWKARAMENTGSVEVAKSIYTELSSTRHYYGFLSSMRINKAPTFNNKKTYISKKVATDVEKFPAIQRIEELIALNRQRNARVEWHHLLKSLSEEKKLHFAYSAFKKGWYDLSILALARAEQNDDLSLRFPVAYQKPILHYAKKFDLDPAWVFALTRQESAFFTYATSPVGAIGLMQLMPDTAIHVAAKNKVSLPSKYHLYIPEKNIELGTTYLKYLKDKWHQNPIVTTASYNAGPGRAKQWLPKQPIDADIWVENIPFEETRNYVKNVISSTSIYQNLLGKPVQLNHYMKPISSHK